MIKTTLTVSCVLGHGHEHEVEDHDDKIRLQGYTRCNEPGCERNAWVVKIATQGEPGTEDDMEHLDEITPVTFIEAAAWGKGISCPHCGKELRGE